MRLELKSQGHEPCSHGQSDLVTQLVALEALRALLDLLLHSKGSLASSALLLFHDAASTSAASDSSHSSSGPRAEVSGSSVSPCSASSSSTSSKPVSAPAEGADGSLSSGTSSTTCTPAVFLREMTYSGKQLRIDWDTESNLRFPCPRASTTAPSCSDKPLQFRSTHPRTSSGSLLHIFDDSDRRPL